MNPGNVKRELSFWKKGAIGFLALIVMLALFYWIVQESWSNAAVSESFASMQKVLPDLTHGAVVEQQFDFAGNQIDSIVIYPSIPQEIEGTLTAEICQGEAVLAQTQILLNQLENMAANALTFAQGAVPANEQLTLKLTVTRPEDGKYFSLYFGDTVDAGRYVIASGDVAGLRVNGESIKGHLDWTVQGCNHTDTMQIYLWCAGAVLLIYVGLAVWLNWCRQRGKRNIFFVAVEETKRYRFLMECLVSRDFNTKYRQSVLGVLWSFLNPLLTMVVQYIVFSTLFKSNIPNFVVYLLSGIVMFNFFSEASNMGMTSISSNASLINKVYVPKYIYPFSRVISSTVNLLIALIPLLATVIISGLPITKAFLLLPFPIICLVAFALGMSLLLATSNVFFRDTAFLWSVVIMMWNFLTPIFYPESIIPANLIQLYHMNPMYQFVYFVRCILMEGVTPQPVTYLYCILGAGVPLALGLWVFRKQQNKFILYL